MTIETLDAPSANITLPLNQSVQQANGAQFALMLSLMMESLPASTTAAVPALSTVPAGLAQPATNFNLDVSQTRALQNQQLHHFHLLHSLYEERRLPVDGALQQGNTNADVSAEILHDIEQRHSSNPMTAQAAEKVSFAA